ncbi:MAG: hypothetical protein JWP36_486 [Paucimonas sp.]|nr:hypothetical protein [Paucimonas sp.]
MAMRPKARKRHQEKSWTVAAEPHAGPQAGPLALPASGGEAACQAWLREVENRFRRQALPDILDCFHQDVVAHYNLMPALHGKAALAEFLSTRYAGMADYQLEKQLRCHAAGPLLGVEVRFGYTDRASGQRYLGKGFEYLLLRDACIARWDYVCTTVPAAAGRSIFTNQEAG